MISVVCLACFAHGGGENVWGGRVGAVPTAAGRGGIEAGGAAESGLGSMHIVRGRGLGARVPRIDSRKWREQRRRTPRRRRLSRYSGRDCRRSSVQMTSRSAWSSCAAGPRVYHPSWDDRYLTTVRRREPLTCCGAVWCLHYDLSPSMCLTRRYAKETLAPSGKGPPDVSATSNGSRKKEKTTSGAGVPSITLVAFWTSQTRKGPCGTPTTN